LLIITVILHSQHDSDGKRNEKALLDLCLKPKEVPEMAGGLRYFLTKVVSKTDLAGGKDEKDMVRWGCRIVGDALRLMSTQQAVVDE